MCEYFWHKLQQEVKLLSKLEDISLLLYSSKIVLTWLNCLENVAYFYSLDYTSYRLQSTEWHVMETLGMKLAVGKVSVHTIVQISSQNRKNSSQNTQTNDHRQQPLLVDVISFSMLIVRFYAALWSHIGSWKWQHEHYKISLMLKTKIHTVTLASAVGVPVKLSVKNFQAWITILSAVVEKATWKCARGRRGLQEREIWGGRRHRLSPIFH